MVSFFLVALVGKKESQFLLYTKIEVCIKRATSRDYFLTGTLNSEACLDFKHCILEYYDLYHQMSWSLVIPIGTNLFSVLQSPFLFDILNFIFSSTFLAQIPQGILWLFEEDCNFPLEQCYLTLQRFLSSLCYCCFMIQSISWFFMTYRDFIHPLKIH